MYNRQLDTFFKVVELGSLSKAAEALYITPSAVVQQINNLEASLDAKLLKRTPRGTTTTAAGEILYQEGQMLIQTSRNIRERIRLVQEEEHQEICVGTSPVEQCRLFYRWWNCFTEGNPNYHVKLKPIQSMGNEAEREGVDIIEGVYVGDMCGDTMDFLPLTTVPIVHGVWKGHPLAKKKLLRYEDMKGQTLVTLSGPGLSDHIVQLRKEAEQRGIRIVTAQYYDISTFAMCAVNGYIMQMPLTDKYAHSEFVAIPSDWNYTLPYGLYYRKDSSPLVQKFVQFMEEQSRKQEIHFSWDEEI